MMLYVLGIYLLIGAIRSWDNKIVHNYGYESMRDFKLKEIHGPIVMLFLLIVFWPISLLFSKSAKFKRLVFGMN